MRSAEVKYCENVRNMLLKISFGIRYNMYFLAVGTSLRRTKRGPAAWCALDVGRAIGRCECARPTKETYECRAK